MKIYTICQVTGIWTVLSSEDDSPQHFSELDEALEYIKEVQNG